MRLMNYTLVQGETGILVKTDGKETRVPVEKAITSARAKLKEHIGRIPEFHWSLEPIEPPDFEVPSFIENMYSAAAKTGVGPFASVAGALSWEAARAAMGAGANCVLVENGGDMCITGSHSFKVAIHAGSSPFSQKIALDIPSSSEFIGLCTSSSRVGESISFGDAEAVVAYSSNSPTLADAGATAVCNAVRGSDGIDRGVKLAKKIGEIGFLIFQGDRMGIWGDLPHLVSYSGEADLIIDPRLHSRAT